ncbi:hypothetical protein SAMN05216255_0255 [Pseudomonas segetis]|uniref:Uncharacterized protein n=1 Tax=Pseudomonas segetis TaxID=298908 RepID=A0A238Z959_9PSED|nr:hypothetical protein SAMN05216255_0255 [Pseudomonas segetis]
MGLINARLRQWLFSLCQSRSGQCLQPPEKPSPTKPQQRAE